MKKLIGKVLDKFFPLRDEDGDLDMINFFVVGRLYRKYPFYRLNAKLKNVYVYILSSENHTYLYATEKLVGNYIYLGRSEVRRIK